MFDNLPPRIVDALTEAGWTPDRRVSLDGWHRTLASEGYVLSDTAAGVLTALGGLRVRPVVKGPYSEPLLFEPVLAGSGARDIAEEFEAMFAQRFYPVAEWISNACVFVGDAGKVVSYDDIEWLDIADDFAGALEVFLLAEPAPRVIEPPVPRQS